MKKSSGSTAKNNPEKNNTEKNAETVYSFPTRSRCPRCGSLDTVATGKNQDVQYRQCRMAVCRQRYTVIGQKV